MANDRDFECQQCGAHFNSRESLDQHNRQQHQRQAGSSSSSSSTGSRQSSSSNIGNRGDRDLNS